MRIHIGKCLISLRPRSVQKVEMFRCAKTLYFVHMQCKYIHKHFILIETIRYGCERCGEGREVISSSRARDAAIFHSDFYN